MNRQIVGVEVAVPIRCRFTRSGDELKHRYMGIGRIMIPVLEALLNNTSTADV